MDEDGRRGTTRGCGYGQNFACGANTGELLSSAPTPTRHGMPQVLASPGSGAQDRTRMRLDGGFGAIGTEQRPQMPGGAMVCAPAPYNGMMPGQQFMQPGMQPYMQPYGQPYMQPGMVHMQPQPGMPTPPAWMAPAPQLQGSGAMQQDGMQVTSGEARARVAPRQGPEPSARTQTPRIRSQHPPERRVARAERPAPLCCAAACGFYAACAIFPPRVRRAWRRRSPAADRLR
jgi:hypothetical protein